MSYLSEVLNDSPVFYCPLDEASGNLLDRSPNTNDATFAGTHGATGPDGAASAVALSSGSFVPVRWATTALDAAQAAQSLEVMFKSTQVPAAGTSPMIFGKSTFSSLATQAMYLRFVDDGTVVLSAVTTTSSVSIGSGTALNNGRWHHVVGTYDGANLRLYVDGALVAGPTACTGNLRANGTDITAGAYDLDGFGANYRYTGSLARAAVYPVALSAARVTAHFAAIQADSAGAARAGNPGQTLSGVIFPLSVTDVARSAWAGKTTQALSLPTGALGLTDVARGARATKPGYQSVLGTLFSITAMTVDLSQGWGFTLATSFELDIQDATTVPGSRISVHAETYPTPVLVDGRPVS